MTTKIGFVFPGQGSQSTGMGFSLISKYPDFEPIFLETLREADATLGFPLSTIIQNGPDEKLKQTDITQPALLTVSTAMARWLKGKGVSAHLALGHSLGEYSALVYSEALGFQDALRLVHLRGKLMQTAVPSGQGGMAALIGASKEAAENLCKKVQSEIKKILEISAFNSPGQIVVSGHIEAIDLAVKSAKELGIRLATKLEVSGPFHCSLLEDAGKKLGEALAEVNFTKPLIPVISNSTAQPQWEPDEIRKNLTQQVSKAVLWQDSVHFAYQKEIKNFVEVGSGKVLTGLLKKIEPKAKCTPLEASENLNF